MTEESWKIWECLRKCFVCWKLFYKCSNTILDVGKRHVCGTPCPFPSKGKGIPTGSFEHEVSFKERWVERKGMVFTMPKQAPIFSRGWTIPSPQSVSGKQRGPSVPALIPKALCALPKRGHGRSAEQPIRRWAGQTGCRDSWAPPANRFVCTFHKQLCGMRCPPPSPGPTHLPTPTSAFPKLFSKPETDCFEQEKENKW